MQRTFDNPSSQSTGHVNFPHHHKPEIPVAAPYILYLHFQKELKVITMTVFLLPKNLVSVCETGV
jgi:hypothetical protein